MPDFPGWWIGWEDIEMASMEKLHIAQYLVNRFGNEPGGVTPLKLQKLLYYVKAWGLVADHNLVPDASFEKWPYGPVDPVVYKVYKAYGRAPIPFMENVPQPRGKQRQLIDFIGTCYAQFDAITLSAMTHKEDPWQVTPSGEIIPEQLMKSYYAKRQFAKNFPFDRYSKPFYPVESDFGHAFTMDMSEEEAEKVSVYPSFQAYLNHIRKASGKFDEWFESRLVV